MNTLHARSTRAGAPRRPWLRARLSFALLSCLACAAALGTTAATATAATAASGARFSSGVQAHQQLAVLQYEHRAYESPRTTARLKSSVPATRPITGEATTLPVLAQSTDRHGQRWLKVMLPGRPNSSSGWIKRAGTRAQSTSWNIQVDLPTRHVWVYYDGRLVRNFPAVVGKPSTPTPSGHFFVEESLIMPVTEAGGPYALALSARSNILHQFAGGPGEIAIHGRDSLGGALGQAQSHGCVRLATADISWLASRIGPGTPVTIQ